VRCNPGKVPAVTVYEKKAPDALEVSEIPEGSHVFEIDTDNSSESDFLISVNPSLPPLTSTQGAARSLKVNASTAGILLNLAAIVGSSSPYQTEGGKPIIRNGAGFTRRQAVLIGALGLVAGAALMLLATRARLL
jgi:hypothetical protein